MSGNIPSLPQGLSKLNLDTNQFSGPLPAAFPKNLISLRIGRNAGLYGDVTNIVNSNMQYLWLGDQSGNYGTSFTGKLTIIKPLELFIDRNNITEIRITDASDLTGSCDISYNPLLDNPHLSNLGVCTRIGLYKLATSTSAKKISTTFGSTTTTTTIFPMSSSSTNLFSTKVSTLKTNFVETDQWVSLSPNSEGQYFPHSGAEVTNYELVSTSSFYPTLTIGNNYADDLSDFISQSYTDTGPTSVTFNILPVEAQYISIWVYIAIAAFIGLCILVLVAGKLLKNPVSKSKFGRKNSFGTLNTTAPSTKSN